MIPERSSYTCTLTWLGTDNRDYSAFTRLSDIHLPGGADFRVGGAHEIQDSTQTNPEELFAASVATCMAMTILAVFSKAQITVTGYEDEPEAVLEFVERRYRVTRVYLRPKIRLTAEVEREKLDNLIAKSHANCFITLSVKSEVIVEPTFIVG